jgi:hypothetical protein
MEPPGARSTCGPPRRVVHRQPRCRGGGQGFLGGPSDLYVHCVIPVTHERSDRSRQRIGADECFPWTAVHSDLACAPSPQSEGADPPRPLASGRKPYPAIAIHLRRKANRSAAVGIIPTRTARRCGPAAIPPYRGKAETPGRWVPKMRCQSRPRAGEGLMTAGRLLTCNAPNAMQHPRQVYPVGVTRLAPDAAGSIQRLIVPVPRSAP